MKNVWWNFIEKHELLFFTLIAVVLLRIPNLWEPYWYGDEGIYLSVGQALGYGRDLYAEIVDHKTPIIYWISQIAPTVIALKTVLLFVSLTSVTLFYFLSKRLFSKQSWFHAVSFIAFALLTTLPTFEGNIFNGELLLMPFVLAGILSFWVLTRQKEARMWHWVLPGFFFGLAILTKVPALFDFIGVVIFYLLMQLNWHSKRALQLGLQKCLLMISGVLIPIGLSVGYFAFLGNLQEYLDFGLFYNFRYIQAWSSPSEHAVFKWLFSMQGRIAILVGYLLLIWRLRKKITRTLLFILIWYGLSLFAALLSLRPYSHYAIQILPAASLLLGYFAAKEFRLRILSAALLLISIGIWSVLGFKPYPTVDYYRNFINYARGHITQTQYYEWFDKKTTTTYALSEYLRERTSIGEPIFIWGNEPMVYSLSRRPPVGRFIVDFHIKSFPGAQAETLAALKETPPRYIVVSARARNTFVDFFEWLEENYRIDTSINHTTIYKRLLVTQPN